MRWAVLSDVHGNLEALHAVVEDLSRERADQIAFLGDAVGYGANPNECVALLKARTELAVAGNHDYGAVGLIDIDNFNPPAETAILWTGERLTRAHKAFLRNLPLFLDVQGVLLVHSAPNDPAEWNYIFSAWEAEEGFRAMAAETAFIGHSHRPMILAKEGDRRVQSLVEEEAVLERGIRYIINVGSVGQPRDGNPRAAYGLYEDSSRRYALRRVPYDIQTAQSKILRAGLPASLAERLALGA